MLLRGLANYANCCCSGRGRTRGGEHSVSVDVFGNAADIVLSFVGRRVWTYGLGDDARWS